MQREGFWDDQAKAAEISTGAVAALAADFAPRPVAMLIVNMTASYEKKATSLARLRGPCANSRAKTTPPPSRRLARIARARIAASPPNR